MRATIAIIARCAITYTASTESQDFASAGADLVLPSLQDVFLQDLMAVIQSNNQVAVTIGKESMG